MRSARLAHSSFLVLLSLADQPRHGLAIIDRVADVTSEKVSIGPGTLYGTLQKLVAAGLVRETDQLPDPDDHDPRRRYYRLTPKGERELKAEALRMRALVHAAVDHHVLEDL